MTSARQEDEREKQWCKAQLTAFIEAIDDTLPVIGKAMDLPIVDALEKRAVDILVEAIWPSLSHAHANHDVCPWSA
jgi:hypothetical protein